MPQISTSLGERLRLEREKKGWKLREIVEFLGVNTITTYSHWEHNRREPDVETLNKIAELFEVSTDYLLGRDNDDVEYWKERAIKAENELRQFKDEIQELVSKTNTILNSK